MKLPLTFAITLVIAVPVLATQAPTQAPATDTVVLQKILVKVNGAILTKTDLEDLQIEELRERSPQNLTTTDLRSDAKLRAVLQEITPDLLVKAVDDMILVQRGRELGIRMSEENFKTFVDNIKRDNKLDEKQFQEALATQGLTMAQLRKNLERRYIMQGVERNEIMPKIQLTEEEARQYYRAHPEEFMKPSLITLREIFIPVPSELRGGQEVFNQAIDEQVQAKLKEARDRALKGEDFTKLVGEISEGPSKANGGLIGPVNLAELAPALKALLEPLKAGDVTEPIRSAKGYQILRVETRSVAEPEAFETVKNAIGDKIGQTRLDAETSKYVARLREQAIIEWKDEDLKRVYEQRRAQAKQP